MYKRQIKDWIESLSSNLYVVGGALIVTGCLLFASDRVRKGRKNEHSARMTDALIVGAAQALATCPGLSRSGTTISVGCKVCASTERRVSPISRCLL